MAVYHHVKLSTSFFHENRTIFFGKISFFCVKTTNFDNSFLFSRRSDLEQFESEMKTPSFEGDPDLNNIIQMQILDYALRKAKDG